ncbi:manganese catalase family protein [Pannus brasiliensis CCIBt3594]|uniref:Manganese catalase family protein n=1 Tax=Pannus brasiliensis CCIBt3594 TaxID=1427578 RepID=A0AAW9QQ01_9CHRO
MFYHVKELQFDARVSSPDPRFATLLLEQFGGANGELKAAIQYFLQAFAARKPYPAQYDMLMDIATEELAHLEIVGATITMLLDGINGELKDAAEQTLMTEFLKGPGKKEELLQQAIVNPQFFALSGGSPTLTNSQGVPWSGTYVDANGDLTVDIRSNLASESRAKLVYEYLLQFTDDPQVKDTLTFLMTREIAHYQMFASALDSIQPNFPPGVLQGDPRYTHTYFNMSDGGDIRGPWNQGRGAWESGEWVYVSNPRDYVEQTDGLTNAPVEGTTETRESTDAMNRQLGQQRSTEVKSAIQSDPNQWSKFADGSRSSSASVPHVEERVKSK